MTSRNKTQLTPEEIRQRKVKLAEGGIVFALVFGLCVFLGIHFAGQDAGEPITTDATVYDAPPMAISTDEPVAVASTLPQVADDGTEPVAVADETAADQVVEPLTIEEILPEVPIMVTYSRAEQTYFDGGYEEAAAMFAAYCAEHPQNAWGQYMRGLSLWKAGRNDEAVDAFEAALAVKPDHLKSLVNLARVQIERDQIDQALVAIEEAIAIAPENVDARRVLGRVQHQLGRLDDAAATYLETLRRHADDAWALNNLGLVRIDQERFAAALAPLARAVELAPDRGVIRNNLAVALERTGHLGAARDQYELAAVCGSANGEQSFARLETVMLDENEPLVDLAELAASWREILVEPADPAAPVEATVAAADQP